MIQLLKNMQKIIQMLILNLLQTGLKLHILTLMALCLPNSRLMQEIILMNHQLNRKELDSHLSDGVQR